MIFIIIFSIVMGGLLGLAYVAWTDAREVGKIAEEMNMTFDEAFDWREEHYDI